MQTVVDGGTDQTGELTWILASIRHDCGKTTQLQRRNALSVFKARNHADGLSLGEYAFPACSRHQACLAASKAINTNWSPDILDSLPRRE